MKTFHKFHCILWALVSLAPLHSAAETNFVILLVDDAGLMDFGGYGGEAHTPNINQLADEGVRFSNYHTSPLCAPSRAMLLTGMHNHRAGIGSIPEALHESQADSPAYAQHFQPGISTIAARLKAAGYATFMTGKWHLGSESLPNAQGFERSFALDASGADNWEDRSYIPFYADAPWYEDGKPAQLPEDFYSSAFIVDKMIEYLAARDQRKPFFSYLAFQAIHIPVQAPEEFTSNYEGVYAAGWDALREQRVRKAKRLGLMPTDAPPPEPHPSLRAWADLPDDERRHYEKSMMVNAGMLEAMDHHIGRLLDYLKDEGTLANTVFIVTSDNGPEFNDPATDPSFKFWMSMNDYHTDPARAGGRGYMGAIGSEWASVAAVPGSLFKMYASEGGTRVPLIISGPNVKSVPVPNFNPALSFVTDIAPTIADMAQLPAAQNPTQAPTQAPAQEMDGRSLLPLLSGKRASVHEQGHPVGMEVAGNSALFKGRYKLAKNTLPHGDAQWRLHDIIRDPAERNDLSAARPGLRDELLADYNAFANRLGIIPLPADFNIQAQIMENTTNRWLAHNRVPLAASAIALLVMLAALAYFVFRRS